MLHELARATRIKSHAWRPAGQRFQQCIGQVVLQRRQYKGITGRVKQAQAHAVPQDSHLMQRHINTYRFFAFRPKDGQFHTAVAGDMSAALPADRQSPCAHPPSRQRLQTNPASCPVAG